jgi:16S rRNA (cytosine967-C5)-methyltransferase
MTTARRVAADVLTRSRSRDGFAAELIDDALTAANLSPQDRRFVTQLVFGVIRRSGTLDALLRPFIRIPLHAVQPQVWDVLRLGAFQLTFLTHVPRHAAVHETVELAEHVGAPKAKGFINGVLRRIAEVVTDEFTETAGADAVPFAWQPTPPAPLPVGRGENVRGASRDSAKRTSVDAREATPSVTPSLQGGGWGVGSYRRLTQPLLPAPGENPAAYLAAAHSFPQWLANKWLARYGADECARLGFWFNAPPPLWIRVNKLNVDRATYRIQLAAAMIDADPGQHAQSLLFLEHHAIRDLPGYADGDFAVQDHSSMLVASALGVRPGMHVLDLCAAPGGKTTHLAELMDNRGRVTACDIDQKRIDTVTTLCQRLRVKGVETVLLGESGAIPDGPFDAALVDVPCSNTGVLGRRPEVRWRLKPNEFEHLVRLQTRLLIEALTRVKPGGAVVYSTCSVEPEENEGVVKAVCRGMRGIALEAEHRSEPGRPSDGGYWARLRTPK